MERIDGALSFAQLLREHRFAAKLTQETLAERAQLGLRSIQALESGSRLPLRDTLTALSDALGLSAEARVQLARTAQPTPRRRNPGTRDIQPPAATVIPSGALQGRPQLPIPLTSFLGREREVTRLKELLGAHRLVTVTGPPGIGKTRLAQEVASDLISVFGDGVYYVPLAPIRDPDLVLPAIAQVLGVAVHGSQRTSDRLSEALAGRQILLLLDNFEQVAAAAPEVVAFLVACPGPTILITSRVRLGVRGEQILRVPPLALPPSLGSATRDTAVGSDPGPYAAVQLFTDRARAVRPDFSPTADTLSAIAEICHRVDGLPLAIELAAARAVVLSPQVIRDRLMHRLEFLTRGPGDLPSHQQTLRKAIAWSYDLLDAPEQALLRQLSVFAGSFTLEAAEVVCGDTGEVSSTSVLDRLTSLVDTSLVVAERREDGERFHLLETVREYAEEKLVQADEAVAFRDKHRDWILALTERWAAEVFEPTSVDSWHRLAAERDNLHAALVWSQTERSGAGAGLRLATTLGRFGLMMWRRGEGIGEALGWLRTFLDLAPESNATRANALFCGSLLARLVGDSVLSLTLGEQALTLYRRLGESAWESFSLDQIGLTLAEDGAYVPALERIEAAVDLARAGNHEFDLADILRDLGLVLVGAGELQRARAAFEESLEIAHQINSYAAKWRGRLHLGNLDRLEGNFSRAQTLFDEYRGMIGLPMQANKAQTHSDIDLEVSQALLTAAQDGVAMAQGAVQTLLAAHWRSGDTRWTGTLLCVLGVLAVKDGRMRLGVRLIGAGARSNPRYATILFPSVRTDVGQGLVAAQSSIGEDAFTRAWAEGQAMTLEQAVTYALEEDSR